VGTQTINLIVNPLPNLSINPSTPIVLGGQGPTITANGANTYSWSPATNLSSTSGNTVTANPQITTNYTLTGTSSAGCVSNDIFSVGVELWQQTADTFHAPIYYNGNVGIGTNNPQAALDVVGNAIVTGTLTAGGLNSTNGNLNVSTPAVFTNSVTVSSLANSNASGDRMLLVDPSGHILPGGSIGAGSGTGSPWVTGGNSNGSLYTIGTNDANDLPFVTGNSSSTTGVEQMRITQGGLVGIGTPTPYSLLHLNTQNIGAIAPGLIVDNANPIGGPFEFNVNSDGSVYVYNIPDAHDILSLNGQDFRGANSNIFNYFRVTTNGQVGIGTTENTSGVITPVSAYKMLTVSGDVSLANYLSSGTIPTDGQNGIEILGGNKVPTSRGVSTDDATSSGAFNFFINSNQTNSQFNFKDGNGNNTLLTVSKNGNTGQLFFNGDQNHGLGVYTTNNNSAQFAGANINGPVLYGFGGGALGSNQGGTQNIALQWDNSGDVTVLGGSTNSPFIVQNIGLSSSNKNLLEITANGQLNLNYSNLSPGDKVINVVENGSSTSNFAVYASGYVYSRQVVVAAPGVVFPDYVFKPDYKLMSLAEMKKYTDTYHHLPNMPTAKEVEENGANLGEIQRVSVEKIEELYLHMIALNKKVEKLEKENVELKSEINKIKTK
jgi:hypothetical protein